MERNIKRRVCDKLNEDGEKPLVYMDTPWADLSHRLLEVIEGHEEGPDPHANE